MKYKIRNNNYFYFCTFIIEPLRISLSGIINNV